MVDRADLLGAVPGDLDGDVVLVGGECGVQAGSLPGGEVFGTGAQYVPDPVQRVSGTTPVTVDVLVDPTPDFVDHAGGQLDDAEGVQDGDGVFELVIDGVLVAVERVEGGDLHAFAERVAALSQPALVHRAGAAGDQIKQPDPDTSVRVAGQIDHPGEFLGSSGSGVDVMPQVLVHAQRGHPDEPGLIGSGHRQQGSDRAPHRLPRHPELPGRPVHRRVFAAELVRSPTSRPGP